MEPRAQRTFIMGWMVGTLIILGCQIVAVLTPPPTSGGSIVVLIGPGPVVFAALAAGLLALWLLIRTRSAFLNFTRLGGSAGLAATGLLGSFATVFAVTIAVNLLVAHLSS